MGYTPIYPQAQQWDRQQSFYEEYNLRRLEQFDRDLANSIRMAEMDAASNAQVAGIYASAGMAEAAEAARAKVEAANIAAQAMRDVSQMDNATRMQIAELQAEVERERIGMERRIQESREFGQPINLASYIHYMSQGPGTAVPGVLPQQAPPTPVAATGTTPITSMASLYQTGMPGQAQMGTPAAIVGEGGPELAQATPQGLQVTPIASQQVKPLQRMLGIPGMQGGGLVGMAAGQTLGTVLGGRARRSPQQSSFGNISNRLRPAPTDYSRFAGQRGGYGQQVTRVQPYGGASVTYGGGPPRREAAGGAATPTAVTPGGGGTPVISYHQPPPGGGGGITPTTPGGGTDWQAFIDQLYGNVPAYSWTGGLELPEIGVSLPYAPFGQNVTDWQRLPWQVQRGRESMWRALGIMPETAAGMMYAAAPTGIAQPVPRWG